MSQSKQEKDSLRVVIVGGVAGGASAAARARRLSESAEITIIERGPDVSFANCGLPYHIGGEIKDRSRLAVQTPESLREMLNVDVRTLTEATAINRDAKTLTVKDLESGESSDIAYDKLILSPGASPLRPPLPGIDDSRIVTLRTLGDMDRIKAAAEERNNVLVIGAGFIGLEMAEQLVHLGKRVTLVELTPQVLPQMDAELTRLMEDELRANHVDLILGDGIKAFQSAGEQLEAELDSGRKIQAGLVILSIGVRPETSLAKEAGLELGERGHIVVNEFQQTSDADIYAAGDAVETSDPILDTRAAIPLGGPANRQGRVAADHIVRPDIARPYPGSIGTSIVRAFDTSAGLTGWTERRLEAVGKDYGTTTVTDFNHAGYYPGAVHVTVKILWDLADGRLLGGQVTGALGVDKRLDVLATAIRGRLTIADLCHLELAYAPPFGSAKDPINIAGFNATNIQDGLFAPTFDFPDEGTQVVDARPALMAEAKPMPGAINIPLPELRDRMEELDRSKPVVTVCALGKSSYFAARILSQNGFDVKSLVGGTKLHSTVAQPPVTPSNLEKNSPPVLSAARSCDVAPVMLDATGLACPGPIMKVKDALADLAPGQVLEVAASDTGFATDLPAFCKAQGLEFLDVKKQAGIITGRLRKSADLSQAVAGSCAPVRAGSGTSLVIFSQEMDKVLAGLVIANGAAAMGGPVTIFFTFWGINALRKEQGSAVGGKSFMAKMFGWMLPRGLSKLPLSNMHMMGMGTAMMKQRMASKGLPNVQGLLADAKKQKVRLVVCSMSMEAMGIRLEELIDGVEVGGVADFLGSSAESSTNLFI
ncbi:MAG: FAD-dependent oxidoreductase [Verrucomicrobiales bacterium]|nr:FAD-dependent oxidoreductase [Verrucomicrobiales bacterium]